MRPRRQVVPALLALGALLGCSPGGGADASEDAAVVVAAASSLRAALDPVVERYTRDTGVEVTVSYGSSGLLREQILNGAPYALFMAADPGDVDAVIAAGEGDPATRAEYARGRLALVAAPGASPPRGVEDLTRPEYRRIAIANPVHAPYGHAARQALRTAGIHEVVADRIVLGESVADTVRIVESGNAEVGIVAWSLVVDDAHVLVPDGLHDPLRQTLVVTADPGPAGAAARSLAAHLTGDATRATLTDAGFEPPGDGTR